MTVTLSRRAMLGATSASLVGAVGLAQAEAAAAVTSTAVTPSGLTSSATTRRVTQLVATRWTYDAGTGATKVLAFKRRTVTARMAGTRVQVRNAAGAWVRVPYVWSPRKRALVYSRKLHLQMLGGATAPRSTTATAPKASVTLSSNPYLSADQARHLLRRATFGPTSESMAELRRVGVEAWLDQQLNPSTIPDAACEKLLTQLPDQSDDMWLVRDDIRRGIRKGWDQQMSVSYDHIARACFSERQLLAVMEGFWGNHFNVTVPHDRLDESRAHYAHTIRMHAFGRFSDLLKAVSLHPAMLTYLNNRDSDDLHPNENQGRELLELHTVGVEAGYTEDEVLAAARILTGQSVDHESGEYEYKSWLHWVGPVSVLGFSHANTSRTAGTAVVNQLLDHLATHPATANRIARKLCQRFISDNPPPSIVDRLADLYLASDTRIAPVLRALFTSDEFKASIGSKKSRPFETLTSTVRLLGMKPPAGIAPVRELHWMLNGMGQTPFGQAFPTGWSDLAADWTSPAVTLGRWNAVRNLTEGWWPNGFPRPKLRDLVLPATLPATHGEAIDAIATALLGMPMSAAHTSAALGFLGVRADTPLSAGSDVATWRLGSVVALILDSPYHLYR